MEDINLITWNYKDNPDSFSRAIKNDYSYFENIMEKNNLRHYAILATCNRIEIYYMGDMDIKNLDSPIYIAYPDSIKHLLRVSAGLESMAIGENDILRQIKDAFELASKRGHSDKFLSYTFQKVLSTGKEIRTNTDIAHGKTSISTISLDIIDSQYSLGKKNICIIGTGKMATSLLNYLAGFKGKVTVAGRSLDRARNLAIKYGAYYNTIGDIQSLLNDNDIIITATSSKSFLIRDTDLNNISGKILIDLSSPPNIEKLSNKNNILYDLDKIYEISSASREHREKEISHAEEILNEELISYTTRINEMKSDDVIAAFYKFAVGIKKDEISELKRKVEIDPEQEKVINIMMDSFINKLLAPYTNSVKEFIKNNQKYSYILKEYDTLLKQLTQKKDEKIENR